MPCQSSEALLDSSPGPIRLDLNQSDESGKRAKKVSPTRWAGCHLGWWFSNHLFVWLFCFIWGYSNQTKFMHILTPGALQQTKSMPKTTKKESLVQQWQEKIPWNKLGRTRFSRGAHPFLTSAVSWWPAQPVGQFQRECPGSRKSWFWQQEVVV